VKEISGPKFEDFVDLESGIPMNAERTVGLASRLKLSPREAGLESFELASGYGAERREELVKKAAELATVLKMKHGYTFDIDLLVDALVHLRKIGFMDGSIRVFYFQTPQPLIVESSNVYDEPLNYLLIAPRIEE